jgi:hypothetical protein
VRIARAVGDRLGVADGQLVEVVRTDGPSLLAWAEIADVAEDICVFDAGAAPVLGAAPGGTVALRRVRELR